MLHVLEFRGRSVGQFLVIHGGDEIRSSLGGECVVGKVEEGGKTDAYCESGRGFKDESNDQGRHHEQTVLFVVFKDLPDITTCTTR